MCGIVGIAGILSEKDKNVIQEMNNIISYRGPDCAFLYQNNNILLGHSRLSIIDLDIRASQPFISNDGRYVLVFNGEIYNYKELRLDLSANYHFKTKSDTEVLLAAYITWGKDCLNRFLGMFAFCVYDNYTKTVFLARDNFGQKPLFYTENNGKLIFASEIKSILCSNVIPEPNYETWSRYLLYSSYDDDENTFFKDIYQLKPGEYLTKSIGHGLKKTTYFELNSDSISTTTNIEEASIHVYNLLLKTVKYHMRSDVPVGLALSGGLDSSTLLTCLDRLGSLDHKLECFSFSFYNSLSESEWIDASLSNYNLNSLYVEYTKEDFVNDIKPLMWHLEGPIGGLANCALAKMIGKAKQLGITVIQDGTGLDEAFGGYKNHHDIFLKYIVKKHPNEAKTYIKEYSDFWRLPIAKTKIIANHTSHNSISSIDGTNPINLEIFDNDFKNNHKQDLKLYESSGSELYNHFIDYIHKRKIPRNTRMKDRVSMAYSTELRIPFLEADLIKYAISIPEELHFYKGRSKSVIREAMKGPMNEKVRLAPKRSIQAPQGEWLMKEPMKTYINQLICSESFADRGIYNIDKVKHSYKEFCKGKHDNSFFVWQWINLEEWFRIFIDNDATIKKYPLNKLNY